MQTSITFNFFIFQTLPDSAVATYAASLKDKGALVPALYKVIRENYSDVCRQFDLFNLLLYCSEIGP